MSWFEEGVRVQKNAPEQYLRNNEIDGMTWLSVIVWPPGHRDGQPDRPGEEDSEEGLLLQRGEEPAGRRR